MDIFDALLKKIEEERQPHITTLLNGNISDFAEYKRVCGVLRGLSLADEMIRDLAQRMKQDDDND